MPRSSSRRWLAAAVSGLVAAPLTALAAPSPAAAAPVDLTLVNINDFHGRIDANTTKFATTVEDIRTQAGDANTLLLSAGDNIGASLFASASQQDEPTLDVLDALEMDGSAVGNHEFDRGFEDLQGRVQDRADFDYLGANVYAVGTQDPVLDEYAIYEAAGLDVGVIGAVTQETPSLVSPAGITELDFGDPVEAVNRVAAQLSDGDETNGEADVIVAEYHEGSSSSGTLEEQLAEGGVYERIVNDTAGSVDAIFTGHTHAQYAHSAPKPGGGTRPVVQTGSYGENVGRVDLVVDDVTGEVTAHTQANVARSATENLAYPRVQEVKEITDAALAQAAEIGNEPVGSITDDITRARTAEGTEDRGSESTLGDLVGNALRDGIPADLPQADIGVTNPGGIRADLVYAGDTSENPANTDGVVTFAEANAVLPFANNISVVTLTGAQFKQVLEEQWQPAGASRPFLHLGLSDNVEVTLDASRAAGDRVTSVRVDGEPLDPAREYTVSTPSFLAAGGDNFTTFADGEARDTGLLDRDLWIGYLEDNAGISPDFARQQVYATGIPEAQDGANPLSVDLTRLDIASDGAPANTEVEVQVTRDGAEETVTTVPVVDGAASIDGVDVTGASEVRLVAGPSGTTVTIPREAEEPEPEVELEVTTNARSQCVDGRAAVAVYARNTGNVWADIRLTTQWGTHKVSRVAPGDAAYRLFETGKRKVKAGEATVAAYHYDGEQGYYVTEQVPYDALKCKPAKKDKPKKDKPRKR